MGNHVVHGADQRIPASADKLEQFHHRVRIVLAIAMRLKKVEKNQVRSFFPYGITNYRVRNGVAPFAVFDVRAGPVSGKVVKASRPGQTAQLLGL